MKELFPLHTFQQDAVLKRLDELYEISKDIKAFDGDIILTLDINYKIASANIPTKDGIYRLIYESSVVGQTSVYLRGNEVFFAGTAFSFAFAGYGSKSSDFVLSTNSYSKVEANPTLAGTEMPLTCLQVGSDKYKVSGGTKLYLHKVSFKDITYSSSGQTLYPTLYIYSNESNPAVDFSSLKTLLDNVISCDKWRYENPNYNASTFYKVILNGVNTNLHIFDYGDLCVQLNPITNFNVYIYNNTSFTTDGSTVTITNTINKSATNSTNVEDVVTEL